MASKKKAFNYVGHGIDEAVVDEIFTRRRCDVMIVRAPPFHPEPSPAEKRELWKTIVPKKLPAKKKRPAGPFDAIIRHLSALIGSKNLSKEHRLKYVADRTHYQTQQKAHRDGLNPPGRKMFIESIKRYWVFDLVEYIQKCRKAKNIHDKNYTLAESFDLAAQVCDARGMGSLSADSVETHYWNAFNSNRNPYQSKNP